MTSRRVDFKSVAATARPHLPTILARWLPGGRKEGHEYIVRNPRRGDSKPGSFSINMQTGAWGDFATGDKGGDVISLAAYLFGLSQLDAARKVAAMLGIGDD